MKSTFVINWAQTTCFRPPFSESGALDWFGTTARKRPF
jgi:hypothetical protein